MPIGHLRAYSTNSTNPVTIDCADCARWRLCWQKIQENINTNKVWRVSVANTHGGSAHFDFANDPGFKVGDSVRKSGNTVVHNCDFRRTI